MSQTPNQASERCPSPSTRRTQRSPPQPKADVREGSARLKLRTADKAAFACLGSRIPYGTEITQKRLGRIAAAEQFLRDKGFHQFRCRFHDDIVRIEVPEGTWKAMSVWNTHSGGHIRGVFPEEESGSVTAPPAADILNPEAVACFLRLTHDRYYEHLSGFFGTTIIALFTDEPGVFGKQPLRPEQPRPFTPGLVEWLRERWGRDPRPWLPAGRIKVLRDDQGPLYSCRRGRVDSVCDFHELAINELV